jgi:AcrR family transcriptional regulator
MGSALEDEGAKSRTAGIVAFARARKQDSRERLLEAALSLFLDRGYYNVVVDDIVKAAGVGRITFYRHFSGKVDLAVELYKQLSSECMPLFRSIRDADFRDPAAVADWIRSLFEADRNRRELHRVFSQAIVESPAFNEPARNTIRELIGDLGARIPAFAVDPDKPQERRQWLKAFLVLFEILDQSGHAALDAGVAPDPLIIELLTERFVDFVGS